MFAPFGNGSYAALPEQARGGDGCEAGLKLRFAENHIGEADQPAYWERLHYELRFIKQLGFSGYFLIVAGFINFAKSKRIPVGPGRESGCRVAGCLVDAYHRPGPASSSDCSSSASSTRRAYRRPIST